MGKHFPLVMGLDPFPAAHVFHDFKGVERRETFGEQIDHNVVAAADQIAERHRPDLFIDAEHQFPGVSGPDVPAVA